MTLRTRLAVLLSKGESSSPYAPEIDGEPDPGEVVWAWVPYEEDPSQGKDRPVLVLDTDGDGWTGLMLSSQDHDRDAADEARFGRYWMDVGTGGRFQVPALYEIVYHAPYLHDGRAETLEDLVATHGNTLTLSETERSDIAAYLRTL